MGTGARIGLSSLPSDRKHQRRASTKSSLSGVCTNQKDSEEWCVDICPIQCGVRENRGWAVEGYDLSPPLSPDNSVREVTSPGRTAFHPKTRPHNKITKPLRSPRPLSHEYFGFPVCIKAMLSLYWYLWAWKATVPKCMYFHLKSFIVNRDNCARGLPWVVIFVLCQSKISIHSWRCKGPYWGPGGLEAQGVLNWDVSGVPQSSEEKQSESHSYTCHFERARTVVIKLEQF